MALVGCEPRMLSSLAILCYRVNNITRWSETTIPRKRLPRVPAEQSTYQATASEAGSSSALDQKQT